MQEKLETETALRSLRRRLAVLRVNDCLAPFDGNVACQMGLSSYGKMGMLKNSFIGSAPVALAMFSLY